MSNKQAIEIPTNLYIKLKDLSEQNASSVENEVKSALDGFIDADMTDNPDMLADISVISSPNRVLVALPEELYEVIADDLENVLIDYVDSNLSE